MSDKPTLTYMILFTIKHHIYGVDGIFCGVESTVKRLVAPLGALISIVHCEAFHHECLAYCITCHMLSFQYGVDFG
jgi:hypothetical protein